MIKLQSFLDKLNMPEDQQDSFLAEYASFRDIIKDKDGPNSQTWTMYQGPGVSIVGRRRYSVDEMASQLESKEERFDSYNALRISLNQPKSSPSSWKKHLKHDNQDLNGDDEDLLEYLKDRLGVANDYVNRDKSNPTIADELKLDQMAFKQLNMALQSMLIQYLKRADQQDKINLVTNPCEMYARYKFKIVIEEK
tara:strand:- start:391 stop:975 length:585 start_codon:yes stop_codon:yes gene_type:complete